MVSNVLVGCAVGMSGLAVSGSPIVGVATGSGSEISGISATRSVAEAVGSTLPGEFPWVAAAWISLALSLIYVAGMAFNDAMDLAVDLIERPERPIPSGRISVPGAYTYGTICALVGLVILLFHRHQAMSLGVLLVGCILAYDVLHHRALWPIAFMGVCRALVYVVAAAAVINWSRVPLLLALGLGALLALYTITLTFLAKHEGAARIDAQRWYAYLLKAPLVLGPFVIWILWRRPEIAVPAATMLVAALFWISRGTRAVFDYPPRIREAVGVWIQAMPLVDGFFLALLGWPTAAAVAFVCFALTVYLQKRVAGT